MNKTEDHTKAPGREFRGIWIPSAIWKNKLLTIQQKVFLAEIDSLSGAKGCFASNEYFADFFGLSKSRVSNVISSLEKANLITISFLYKDGTKQVDRRIIRPKGYDRPLKVTIETKAEEPEVVDELDQLVKKIVGYLNKQAERDFKPSAASTKRHIKARIREGYKAKDFKLVIDQKVEDWIQDIKMREFLRPETLFGPKFEGYLMKARTRPKAKYSKATKVDHSELFGGKRGN